MKIVYISLPISGKCEQKQRLKALDLQRKFESIGYEVVNPFHLADRLVNSFRTIGKAEPSYEDYLKEDLNNLEDCTHIFLCEGWRFSKGCVREAEHALLLEKEILYETKYKF